MLVHCRVTPSIKFASTHLYTWVERGTVRVKCLAQEHNTMSLARARTRSARSGVECANHEAAAPPTHVINLETERVGDTSFGFCPGVQVHGHTPNNRLTEDMQPWFTVYFFDIGHPCYEQLTPFKTRYLLTSITWPYRRLESTTHQGYVIFEVDRWPSAGFQLDRRLKSG